MPQSLRSPRISRSHQWRQLLRVSAAIRSRHSCSAALRSRLTYGIAFNRVMDSCAQTRDRINAGNDNERIAGIQAVNFENAERRPNLFAWIVGGGKNLTPIRRCCLGGPHPRVNGGWRQFCQRLGHSGITKHAEMAAIAALRLESAELRKQRRLTLVVIRVCSTGQAVGEQVSLGLAQPCDECTKIICALGCFRRVIHSTADGNLISVVPEHLLEVSVPSSGKRSQQCPPTAKLSR